MVALMLHIPNSQRVKTGLDNADYDMRQKIESRYPDLRAKPKVGKRISGWEENFGLKGRLLAIL